MAAKTSFSLLGHRLLGNPYAGALLARLNPEYVFPDEGSDLRLPSPAEELAFDPRLGGTALPQGPETARLIAHYHRQRKPRGA